MKLHLPCALRGALLACFAFACTTTAWAGEPVLNGSDITFSGDQVKPVQVANGSFTLKPDAEGTTGTLDTLEINNSSPVTIDISGFTALTITKMVVANNQEATIKIAAGAKVTLADVHFTGKVYYDLGEGAELTIAASDCTAGSISGSGKVIFDDGIINAEHINNPVWFPTSSYDSSLGPKGIEDLQIWCAPYLKEGATTSFTLATKVPVSMSVGNKTGGTLTMETDNTISISWKGTAGYKPIEKDGESVIIDLEGTVRKQYADGNYYWDVVKDASAQDLLEGKLPDLDMVNQGLKDEALQAMTPKDTLHFAGGGLTSSADVTLYNHITAEYDASVVLKPDAGTSMTIKEGKDALSSGLGLVLDGGEGSTVILEKVGLREMPAGKTITIKSADTTLEISGTTEFTFDGSTNIFRDDSHLCKNDGGTLYFVMKQQDAIGSLTNATGIVGLKSAGTDPHTLDVDLLSANELKIEHASITVNAGSITANTITTYGAWYPNQGSTLSVTNDVTVDNATLQWHSTLTANSVRVAENATVQGGATLTGDLVHIQGTTTIADLDFNGQHTGSVSSGNITIGTVTFLSQASITNLLMGTDATTRAASNNLLADSITNAKITVTSTTPNTLLAPGKVTDSTIEATSATTIADSTFVNSTITSADYVALNNTSHDATSHITVTGTWGTLGFTDITVAKGCTITTGDSTYTVTNVPAVTMTGTADKDEMTLTYAYVNVTDTADYTDEIFLEGGGNVVEGNGCILDWDTAAGMIGELRIVDGKLVFTQVNQVDALLEELSSPGNVENTLGVLVPAAQGGTGDVIGALYEYLLDTTRADFADRKNALEALASGSITMLADSQRRGVTNNINNLRNRIVQMGNPQGIELEKNVHAWIQADGSYNDVDQDGTCAGYEYSTWGGTVGVHADVGNFSFGAALSAAYGDLTSHSADNAEADHDSQTLSLFARHQSGGWMQMGILSFGRNEIEMERTINTPRHRGESKVYKGDGDASGHTITAYYEVGHSFALNEAGSQVLQPIASIMLTSARMGDFSETGSIGNAGMNTDTEDYFYGVLGIGARYQVVLAEDVNERLSFLELRAKLVQDIGDETDEATVSFSGVPGQSFTVKGADVGRTGFQFGAGLSVPVGMYTTFFADVDADIRSGATSVNGGVGLRVEF